MSETIPESPLGRVGVVGLGFLGRGIAACALGYGFEVVGISRDAKQRTACDDFVEVAIDELIEHLDFDPSLRELWRPRFTATSDYSELSSCEFVIESVAEDLSIKQQVFDAIEAVIEPNIPIASNTSAIPITRLQEGRQNPGRFVGMHWAEPAHATRFLELIRGEHTTDTTFDVAERIGRLLGKDPCRVERDIPGFIVNRLGYSIYREALSLIERGVADAETIDRAFRNAVGLWASFCGPLRWIDITGGPEFYERLMRGVLPTLSNASEPPAPIRELANQKLRGSVGGRGFYEYTEEESRRWEKLYHEQVWAVRRVQAELAKRR